MGEEGKGQRDSPRKAANADLPSRPFTHGLVYFLSEYSWAIYLFKTKIISDGQKRSYSVTCQLLASTPEVLYTQTYALYRR